MTSTSAFGGGCGLNWPGPSEAAPYIKLPTEPRRHFPTDSRILARNLMSGGIFTEDACTRLPYELVALFPRSVPARSRLDARLTDPPQAAR